jgi:hypothetical protein
MNDVTSIPRLRSASHSADTSPIAQAWCFLCHRVFGLNDVLPESFVDRRQGLQDQNPGDESSSARGLLPWVRAGGYGRLRDGQ